MSLTIGKKHKLYEIVTDEKTARAVESGNLPVYATPSMILLMERASKECVDNDMEEGMTTVGTKVDILHTSASPVGMTIFCQTELMEVDGRRLVFQVNAFDEVGKIGSGLHERTIVNEKRFMEKVNGKRN